MKNFVEIEEKLNNLCKDELNVLARKYKLKNYSSLKKEELAKYLLERVPLEKLQRNIFPGVPKKIKTINLIASIASILGLLVGFYTIIPSKEIGRVTELGRFDKNENKTSITKNKSNKRNEEKMPKQVKLYEIDEFSEVIGIPDGAISQQIIDNVRNMDEEHEIEKYIRQIIFDPTVTPHGPTEIADILSFLHVKGDKKLAAFVLKGKSFKKVGSRDVSHQFFKLRSIPGLKLMIFAAVGNIHDDAKRDFFQAVKDAENECIIMNAHDLAKLFIAYKKICPKDGTPFDDSGFCREGHKLESGIRLEMEVGEKIRYTIVQQKDVSYGGAKRFAAQVLIDKHYPREILRKIIKEITEKLREDTYCHNDLVKERWGDSHAHVIWLDIGHSIEDVNHSNWSCQSLWIDPLLEKNMRPLALYGNEFYENIEILWNENYKKMESIVEEHIGTKKEVLTILFRLLGEMDSVSNKVINLFKQYKEGILSESIFFNRMRELIPRIERIYKESGLVPLPPPDCNDFYEACRTIFCIFHNMSLYYSEKGLKQWKKKNRDYLMASTIKSFLNEYEAVKFERRKLQ